MAKPIFDPSKPFEPVVTKPPFDPSKEFSSADNQQASLDSGPGFLDYAAGAGRNLVENAANTFSQRNLSNIYAGAGNMINKVLPESMGNGLSYTQMRDLVDQRLKNQSAEFPEAATTGKIAGLGAQMYGLGKLTSAAGKGVGLITKFFAPAVEAAPAVDAAPEVVQVAKQAPGLVKRALVGAAKGSAGAGALAATENPGNVPGEVTPLQFNERLQNVEQAIPWGAGLGAVGGVLSDTKSLGKSMRSAAEIPATKAAGPFMRDLNEIEANNPYKLKQELQSQGRTALDQGVVGGFPKSPQKLAESAFDANNKVGEKFGKYIDTVNEALKTKASRSVVGEGPAPLLGVDMDSVGEKVKKNLTIPNPRTSAARAHNQAVDDLVSDLTNKNQPKILDVDTAQSFKKNEIDKLANHNKPKNLDPTPEELRYRAVSRALKEGIAESADDAIDYLEKNKSLPEGFSKEDFLKTKKDFGNLKDTSAMTMKQLKKSFSNNSSSLTASMAGDAAGVIGAIASGGNPLITGGSAYAGNIGTKIAGRYGNQIKAGLLNAGGGLLQKAPNLKTGLLAPILANELRKDSSP